MPIPDGLNDRQNLTSRHRLRDFDYSTPGYYFITVCTHNNQPLFGEIQNSGMRLSTAGLLLQRLIQHAEVQFPNVTVDSSVVMPNHVHLLLHLSLENEQHTPSDVLKWLKGASAAGLRKGVRDQGWTPYDTRVWKEGFHDEIVRDEAHLYNIQKYIVENPARWEEDEFWKMR